MKISIVTVVYNNRETIREAIESVLSQRVDNLEYVIIDGGSTDGTLEIILEYVKANECIKLLSEADDGIYDAMNKGIRLTTGEIIGILNSDDLYADSNVLSEVLEVFKKNTDINVLYGNLVYVKKINTNRVVRRWQSKVYYPGFFENAEVPPHPTLFVRALVYKEVGLFDTTYKLAADYEIMLRIFKKYNYKSWYLNRMMVKMRLGGATNNSFKNIVNGNREILLAWRKNGLMVPLRLMPLRIMKRIRQFF